MPNEPKNSPGNFHMLDPKRVHLWGIGEIADRDTA